MFDFKINFKSNILLFRRIRNFLSKSFGNLKLFGIFLIPRQFIHAFISQNTFEFNLQIGLFDLV